MPGVKRGSQHPSHLSGPSSRKAGDQRCGASPLFGLFAVGVARSPSPDNLMRALVFLFHDVFERDPAESGFAGAAADRYKLSVREFEAQMDGLTRARQDAPILFAGVPLANAGSVPWIFTADDGGVSFYTQLADRLDARRWRAYCFVAVNCIGRRGFLNRVQIRDLQRRGHTIGSHSVSHPTRFSACNWDEMVREWAESRSVLADLLGENVTVASVPGGYFSPRVAAAARDGGLSVLFTSEPEIRVRTIEGCVVVGRFTVRRGTPPDFAARLGRLETSSMLREWVLWNSKKIAKGVLGDAYRQLSGARSR